MSNSKPGFFARLFGLKPKGHPIDDSEPEGQDIRTSREPTAEELERVAEEKHTPGAATEDDDDR